MVFSSLVFNVGYLIFYLLLELSTIFQFYQGKSHFFSIKHTIFIAIKGHADLQPAHTKSWYQIQELFTISLVVQEILALVCCAFCFKFKSLIPDISKPVLVTSSRIFQSVLYYLNQSLGNFRRRRSHLGTRTRSVHGY